MASQRDMTAEALERGAQPGKGYALGRLLSNLFHPVLLSICTFLLVGCYSGPTLTAGLVWALICIALQIVPGTVFFIFRMRQGAYTDEDVSRRDQRNELYLFSIASGCVSLLLVWLAGIPPLFMALQISAFILSVASWLINMFWKISVHAASSASFATVALLLLPTLGVVLWLCAVIVGWARVRTRNHTLGQVAAGMALAAVCVVGIFRAFGVA